MTDRLRALSERRRMLVARCAEQRMELSAGIANVGRYFRIADVARGAARAGLPIAAAALLVALLRRPLRLARWASAGLSLYALAVRAWRVYRSFSRG